MSVGVGVGSVRIGVGLGRVVHFDENILLLLLRSPCLAMMTLLKDETNFLYPGPPPSRPVCDLWTFQKHTKNTLLSLRVEYCPVSLPFPESCTCVMHARAHGFVVVVDRKSVV